jgi:hypothetical protein
VFVDLPLGHTAGPPNDPEAQRTIVHSALEIGATMTAPSPGEPGRIVDLDLKWRDSAWKASPMSWSRRQESTGASGSDAGDTRIPRSDEPQWQNPEDEAAAS